MSGPPVYSFRKKVNAMPGLLWHIPFDTANVTLDTGNTITQADDIVGPIDATQAVLANKPTLINENIQDWGRGGTAAISTKWLVSSPPKSYFNSAFTVFVKIKPVNTGVRQLMMGGVDTVPIERFEIIQEMKTFSILYAINDVTVNAETANEVFTTGIQAVCAAVVAPSGIKLFIDAVEQTLDVTHDGDMSGVTMANYNYSGDYAFFGRLLNGSINQSGSVKQRQLMLFGFAMSDAEIVATTDFINNN